MAAQASRAHSTVPPVGARCGQAAALLRVLPHRRARLGERPAVPLEVLCLVGAVTVLVDRLDDLRARRARTGDVGIEIIHEDPRDVRDPPWLGTAILRLEHHYRAVP